MFLTLVGLKGGIGKTTSAIHIAACLQKNAPTLLIDADKNRSALVWDKEALLPFKVVSEASAPRFVSQFKHVVTDTQARPSEEVLKDLADSCDLMILPTSPKPLDVDAVLKTSELLSSFSFDKYKILLTQVPARDRTVPEVRKKLEGLGLKLFSSEIPRLVALERSPSLGILVKDYKDPKAAQAWKSYEALGKEILA
jgi:chromosome partitioning protein